jgi:predicted PurR-regulated permease PerM
MTSQALSSEALPHAFSERSVTFKEKKAFHDAAGFIGIWLLVILVGVHTLAAMRAIIEPLLWAFFLMMTLAPCVDFVEAILKQIYFCACRPCRARARSEALSSRVSVEDGSSSERDDDAVDEEVIESDECGLARSLAVLFVLCVFVGILALLFVMIHRSVVSVQANFDNYKEGGNRLVKQIDRYKHMVPEDVYDKVVKKVLTNMESFLSIFVQMILDALTGTMFMVVMTLLYLLFWLCAPVYVAAEVSGVFRKYTMLKALASFLYACAIWVLLHFLRVDLAVVFALITFFFNFIPEVGPFLAMVLPTPVILFDGRLADPVVTLCIALAGQMGLKFIFGNIVEVKLIEQDQVMRMHPVIILFFVAFFWMDLGSYWHVAVCAFHGRRKSDAWRNPKDVSGSHSDLLGR